MGKRRPPDARPPPRGADEAPLAHRVLGILDHQLDNQELLRLRQETLAAFEEARAQALAIINRPGPAAPDCPVLALPVTKVLARTSLAHLVVVWDHETWVPNSAIYDPEDGGLPDGWSGTLWVSSRWAQKAGVAAPPGLPKQDPNEKPARRARRST